MDVHSEPAIGSLGQPGAAMGSLRQESHDQTTTTQNAINCFSVSKIKHRPFTESGKTFGGPTNCVPVLIGFRFEIGPTIISGTIFENLETRAAATNWRKKIAEKKKLSRNRDFLQKKVLSGIFFSREECSRHYFISIK